MNNFVQMLVGLKGPGLLEHPSPERIDQNTSKWFFFVQMPVELKEG